MFPPKCERVDLSEISYAYVAAHHDSDSYLLDGERGMLARTSQDISLVMMWQRSVGIPRLWPFDC